MKRIQLIEWGIITIGLFFGYQFFLGIFSMLMQLFYEFQYGGGNLGSELTPIFITTVIYAVMFIVLIRKSHNIASWIGTQATGNDTVPLRLGKRSLLQVILIALCAYTILGSLPDILLYLYELFESGARNANQYTNEGSPKVNPYVFKLKLIQAIVAIVILYFSKDISNWFVRKDEVDELVFDSNPDNR